jgi:hypothetical protein
MRRVVATGVVRAIVALAVLGLPAHAQSSLDGLAGQWRGTLENLPRRPGAPRVTVEMTLGGIPARDDECREWTTRYVERDTVRQVKAYRLCRGRGPDALHVDEGDGVRLDARVVGDVLVSAFRVQGLLLVTHLRVRGDTLEEEIVTIDDRSPAGAAPAGDGTGIASLRVRGIQRLVLVRVGGR